LNGYEISCAKRLVQHPVVPAIFLLQICEGKIGAANPKFFVSIKKIDSKQKPPDLAEVRLRPFEFLSAAI
jgi:hypothetical protein